MKSLPPYDVLDRAVGEILERSNPYAYSTFTAIERHLRQFHLSERIEAYEILMEAYLRGKRVLRTGNIIHNPHAWLKKTAFNVVRENSRHLRRQPAIDAEVLDWLINQKQMEEPSEQLELEIKLAILWQALKTLGQEEPEAAQILCMRVLEELSWQQIHQRLIAEHGKAPNETALRQRACRAKKHLRRIYHACDV